MATRGIRKKEGEDLSDSKIEQVISLLNQETPITKKDACNMLNIAYNTARLNKIIQEHEERKAYTLKRKKELRKQPLSAADIAFFISSYLESGNLSEIADESYRSPQLIKQVLERYNIPLRKSSNNYFNPPEVINTAENYSKDDLVYSARYDQAAYISKELPPNLMGKVYRIWLCKDCQYALQPFYELADLREVQKLGVNIVTRKWVGDLQQEIAQTLINAKKGKNKSE